MKYAAIAIATTIIIIIVLCQHIPSLWHPFIGHVIAMFSPPISFIDYLSMLKIRCSIAAR